MKQEAHVSDYINFMKWFQDRYPDLYIAHQETILMPVDGEGVTVMKDGMDQHIYKLIIDITKEYYQQEHR